MNTVAWICFALAAAGFCLFLWNLFLFRRAPLANGTADPPVSVLIPARNEESTIGSSVEAVLANRDARLEVIVLDDGSEDATAAVVQRIAVRDPRVRVEAAPVLPEGWCGKQHACWTLARMARHDVLCFLDADVRLSPDALPRISSLLRNSRADLISGFPHQETVSFAERLLLPLIHFLLLGYLPIGFMRLSDAPGFSAGCGQLMVVRREAYRKSGGHAAIRNSLHDGLRLPRAFRTAGLRTDIFDATDLAACRMYRNVREVWEGLSKNAVEGMAAPTRLPVFTLLLAGAHVMPFVFFFAAAPFAAAAGMAWMVRLIAAVRFRQPLGSAMLHPLGIFVLLLLQWYALARHLFGRSAFWKGRSYTPRSRAAPVPRAAVRASAAQRRNS